MSTPSSERTRAFAMGVDAIEDTIRLMCENLEGEDLESSLKELKETFNSYQSLQAQWTKSNDCINKLTDLTGKLEDFTSINVEEEYEKLLRNANKELYNAKKVSNEFDIKVQSNLVNKVDNEEVAETQAVFNLIDPITKAVMRRPVKNIHCNHTYDFDSIVKMIKSKGKKQMKCPYQGCVNTVPLSTDDLVPDEAASRKLQQMAQRSSNT